MICPNVVLGPKQALLLSLFCLWSTLLAHSTQAQQQPKRTLSSREFAGYGGLPTAVKSIPNKLPGVAQVAPERATECRKTAEKIDALVESRLQELQLAANPIADDHTFVRRAFLDISGAIPNLIQTNAFAGSKQGRKEEALVDGLLNSYAHVSHMFNYWSSILRLVDRQENLPASSYREWVKEQVRINRPYDQWVREMLTAEGKLWDNPAAGYTLRDDGMPLVHIDNTVRVFLGTQIGCAQCHDHPLDRWTQKDFYALAAFTAGVTTRDGSDSAAFSNGDTIQRLIAEAKEIDPEMKLEGSMEQLLQANLYRVSYDPTKQLRLPADPSNTTNIAGSDTTPGEVADTAPAAVEVDGEVVAPRVPWGELRPEWQALSPREQLAYWLTSADNPRFAKTLANRLWKKVMGVGLIEPVDDLRDDSPCQNAALLDFITQELIRLKFDQKEFLRTLYYTKTYQRASSDFDPSQAEFYHFPGPRLRRMTAEQVWDSVLTIAIQNPFSYQLPDNQQLQSVVNLDMATVTWPEAERIAAAYDQKLGPQARYAIMNASSYRQEILARSSELPSPLPPEHFIRQFGQGDRSSIEGDSTDPTVPQILTMFNGPFTHMMLEHGSLISQNLSRSMGPRDALDVMFLSILNRPPTARDSAVALDDMSHGDIKQGYGDVVWALINTREFLFIQ